MAGNRRGESSDPSRGKGEELSGTFGRYTILSVVGHGAMGTVYRARHQTMGNVLALKVLHPRYSDNPKFIQRFLTEAKASGRLSHPNVVRGIDAGEVEGRYFFAMEFIDGPSLDRIIAVGGRLPEWRALKITSDIAKALEHARANKVVHRDVKPGNILVGSDGTAKLADLGLAVRLDTDGQKAGIAMGTPDYISPEQIRGLPDVDARSDIYSLGMTLYHMLTGHPPFAGDPESVMESHLTAPLPDPSREVQEISPQTLRVLRKMTEKAREDRYQNPVHLEKDLEAVRAGEKVAYQQAARALASRRLKRKRRFNLGVAGIIGAVLLFLGIVSMEFLGSSGPEGGSGPPRRNGEKENDTKARPEDPLDKIQKEIEKVQAALEEARGFLAENPTAYEDAIAKFNLVAQTHGADWVEVVRREIDAVKKAREERAHNLVERMIQAGEKALAKDRLGEAWGPIDRFCREQKPTFGPTKAYGEAEAFRKKVRERIDRAILRFEKEAEKCVQGGDFEKARAWVERIRSIDPETFGEKARSLERGIAEKERSLRKDEETRRALSQLKAAREKTRTLVKGWKPQEARGLFQAILNGVKQGGVRDAARKDLEDLGRISAFFKALGETKG
ncbi:MAG: serine/threonine-protein kinase, partial [Planctomycetota bacterium]